MDKRLRECVGDGPAVTTRTKPRTTSSELWISYVSILTENFALPT